MTHEEKLADMRAAVGALNARNKALEAEVAAKVDALQRVADEAMRHHEYNPGSGKTRLPVGYARIANIADEALNASEQNTQAQTRP